MLQYEKDRRERGAGMERLDKLLAATGRWSRKEVKELVRQGRVTVRGQAVLRPEEKYEPTDDIRVDGEAVCCQKFTYNHAYQGKA